MFLLFSVYNVGLFFHINPIGTRSVIMKFTTPSLLIDLMDNSMRIGLWQMDQYV